MNHIEMRLGNGDVVLLDADDFEIVRCHTWWKATSGYAYTTIKKRSVFMHRLIFAAPANALVDHINRIRLDNRRCNLRLATYSQQAANSVREPSMAGFRGVVRRGNKYAARLKYAGKTIWRGKFLSAEGAAREYDKIATEFFGEFAMLNFP